MLRVPLDVFGLFNILMIASPDCALRAVAFGVLFVVAFFAVVFLVVVFLVVVFFGLAIFFSPFGFICKKVIDTFLLLICYFL